ncbi:MAG: P-loop NTPase family protein [Candidatus Cryosericum sp.]
MKDELHQKIIEGLSRALDGNLFEECAVDLLQPIYKTLVPIKGGRDDGRDGYFYDGAVGSGPLVCTTSEDVKGNVQHSLQEFLKKGHRGRFVIIATSRSLTGEKRNAVENAAKEEGFTTINVHDQSDFALRLYRNREWLKRLLNIVGNQQALSINPISTRPFLSVSVRGREELMNWLDESIASGDVVITGQPGSGKTFAMRSYATQRDGLFVVSDNMDEIVPEVRDKQPRFLIVDDAHGQIALLKRLRQTREDTGAEFLIVATSWLSHRNDVQSALSVPSTSVFELRLLGKDTMVEIIRDCGVKGPDPLLQEIVNQAEGKPGLAATLSQLVLSGDAQDVYYGDALGRDLSTLFERQLGGDALDLLAVTALGGDSGIRLKAAADILNESRFHVQGLATNLAFGGAILEIPPDRISVRPPPLRIYLAKQRFFGNGANIDPFEYLSHYPKLSDTAAVILGASLRGGEVDKERLYRLIERTNAPDLYGGYALLGMEDARRVLADHPDMALESPSHFLEVCPEGILPLMLDKCCGDDRPLHSNPEHPMRKIQDWCKTLPRNDRVPMGNREILLRALSSWKERAAQPHVVAQVLEAVFTTEYVFFRDTPGSGRAFSFGTGHVDSKSLQQLVALLPSASEYFAGPGSVDALKELFGLLGEWVYANPLMGEALTDEQKLLLHTGACLMLSYIEEATKGHPGFRLRLKELALELGAQITDDSDEDFETIHPIDENVRDDFERVAATQRAAAILLAASYSKCKPSEVMAKLARYDKFARDANSTWPDYSLDIVLYLADHVANVAEWAQASVTECDNPLYSYPLLARFYEIDSTRAKDLLLEVLDNSRHVGAAAQVILKRPFKNDTLWERVLPLLKDVVWTVFALVLRGQLGDLTILELLKHPSGEVAMMVAAALAQKDDGKIPDLFADSWENALVEYQFNEGSDDHYVGIALKQYPETIVRWLKVKTAEDTEHYEGNFEETAEELILVLSEDQKAEIISILQANKRSESVATHLVGDIPQLFKCILDNPNASGYRLDALAKVAGSAWRQFAEIAIEAGIDGSDIESASGGLGETWNGPFSKHLLDLSLKFKEGLDSPQPRVVAIAQKLTDCFQKMSDKELEKEKKEDVYG